MELRVCTFNIENLFTRFNFGAFSTPRDRNYLPAVVRFLGDFGDGDLSKFSEFKRLMESAAVAQDDDKRQHTALAIAEADAHVYCLQEVDDIDALRRFFDFYVRRIEGDSYPNLYLHEGNDPRGIDVAAVTRADRPGYARSHATVTPSWIRKTDTGRALLEKYDLTEKEAKKRRRIFRRDCLELEVLLNPNSSDPTRVSIFNCHFKSMSGGGRTQTMGVRQLEAIAVREIITRKFQSPADALWVVCGDLNDYRQRIAVSRRDGHAETIHATDGESGVDPLLDDFGVNLLDQLPQDERWTHFYPARRHKTQLDYIIASPALAEHLAGVPRVIRAGSPLRIPNLDDDRFPRVGWDRPKASDHAPIVVKFDIPV